MLRRFILSLHTCVSVGVSGIANHQTIRVCALAIRDTTGSAAAPVAHPARTTAPPPIPLAAAALRFLTGFKHAPNG
jgi:hypothetical protein